MSRFRNFRIIWPGTPYDDLVNINNGGLGPFYKAHKDVHCNWPTLKECLDLWDVGGSCFETGYDDCSYQSDSEVDCSRAARIRRQWTRAPRKEISGVEIHSEHSDNVDDGWATLRVCRDAWAGGWDRHHEEDEEYAYRSDSELDYSRAVLKHRRWTRAPTKRSRRHRDFDNNSDNNSTLDEEGESGLAAVSEDEDADDEEYFSAEE